MKATFLTSLICILHIPLCYSQSSLKHASKMSRPQPASSIHVGTHEPRKLIEDHGLHFVETSEKGISLTGFMEAGYVYNSLGAATSSTPAKNGRTENPLTKEDSQDFNLYGFHLKIQKPLPKENIWAAGFVMSWRFGEEGFHSHSQTHRPNPPNLPNPPRGTFGEILDPLSDAYVVLRAPVGNGIDISFGRWSKFFGYESNDRPANNNVTVGLLSHFLEPAHHVGVSFKYDLCPLSTFNFALTNGWDVNDSTFFDGSDFSKNLIGTFSLKNPLGNARIEVGASWSPDGEQRFSRAPLASPDGKTKGSSAPGENASVWAFNLNGTWYPEAFNSRLMLGFNTTLVFAQDNLSRRAIYDTDAGSLTLKSDRANNSATMWGAALYARYDLSEMLGLAARLEYLHADDSTLGLFDAWVTDASRSDASINKLGMLNTQTDVISWTFTATLVPVESLMLRAEYRFDYLSSKAGRGGSSLFVNDTNSQHTVALYAVYLLW